MEETFHIVRTMYFVALLSLMLSSLSGTEVRACNLPRRNAMWLYIGQLPTMEVKAIGSR